MRGKRTRGSRLHSAVVGAPPCSVLPPLEVAFRLGAAEHAFETLHVAKVASPH